MTDNTGNTIHSYRLVRTLFVVHIIYVIQCVLVVCDNSVVFALFHNLL